MTELDIKYSEKKKFEAGLAQGREEGREEGVADTKHEIARNLVAMGMPAEKIAEVTGLRRSNSKK